jgi:hypothetical protein
MGVELQRTASQRRASVVSSEPPAPSPDVNHTDISSAPVALGSTEPKLPPLEAEFSQQLASDPQSTSKLRTALAVPATPPMLTEDVTPPSPYLSKRDSNVEVVVTMEDADNIRVEIVDRPLSLSEVVIEAVSTAPPDAHALSRD